MNVEIKFWAGVITTLLVTWFGILNPINVGIENIAYAFMWVNSIIGLLILLLDDKAVDELKKVVDTTSAYKKFVRIVSNSAVLLALAYVASWITFTAYLFTVIIFYGRLYEGIKVIQKD